MSTAIVNAFTVDVEDYFHVSAFSEHLSHQDWDRCESRVVGSTHRVLELLAHHSVTATFFILGWVAERYPALVREIQNAGHEIGSHSYRHDLVYNLTPQQFRDDVVLSCKILEEITGERVTAYRAPSFSITNKSLWALDILIDEGFQIDSSIFPVRHDLYGIPEAEIAPHRIERAGGSIWECPGPVRVLFGQNVPVGGGGYLRILPPWWTFSSLRHLNEAAGRPFVFYVHPWEFDPEQPRVRCGLKSRIRHYTNLRRTERRVRRLLETFQFGPISNLIPQRMPAASSELVDAESQLPSS